MIDRLETLRMALGEAIDAGDRTLSSFALSQLASALSSVEMALHDFSLMNHARQGAVGPRPHVYLVHSGETAARILRRLNGVTL